MDTRYHIEEMVSQDERGVVFQGTDSVTGVIVAIRRFISSGGGGAKAGDADCRAFDESIEILKQVNHPALRRVLAGGCDPVDNMPYLVTRWCEGFALADYLRAGEEFEPELIQKILLDFVDANAAVAEAIGRNGLWLEAAAASIFIKASHPEGEKPQSMFWLSPWQLLKEGTQEDGLLALAALAETLMGGPRKWAAAEPKSPFASWIKDIRNQSIKTPMEARGPLEAMRFGGEPSPATHQATDPRDETVAVFDTPGLKVVPAQVATAPAVAVLPSAPESKSAAKPSMIAATAILLAMAGVVVFVVAQSGSEEGVESPGEVPRIATANPPTPANTPPARVDGNHGAAEERRQYMIRRGYYTIAESDLLQELDKMEITFRGRLANVRNSSSGLTMYLEFSDDAPNEQPRVYAMTRHLVDGIRKEDLERWKGRLLEIRGMVDIETVGSTRRPRVELLDPSRIRALDIEEDYELR